MACHLFEIVKKQEKCYNFYNSNVSTDVAFLFDVSIKAAKGRMSMLRYFVKRILSTIPVLLIISVIVFSMIHLTPGDPAQSMLGPEASEEQVESLRKAMGLYDPLPVQYVNWIADILHGDFWHLSCKQ